MYNENCLINKHYGIKIFIDSCPIVGIEALNLILLIF